MKKYILVGCEERNIMLRGVFDTFEDAHAAMLNEFLNVAEPDKYGEFDGEACGCGEHSAWVNDVFGINYDWEVLEV